MKPGIIRSLLALAVLSAINCQPSTARAQGSLTPPTGAPAPVMKTLDQIEARIPLVAGQPGVSVSASGEITITNSGSYYLTRNLTSTNTAVSCINVGTHNVALDLNGYTISRTNGTGLGTAGIYIAGGGSQMVMIRNGFIVGGGTNLGFASAIETGDTYFGRVHVENVHCARVRNGIILNWDEARNTVRNCSVETSGGEGILAEVVSECTVRNTVDTGIFANLVSSCFVRQDNSGFSGNAIGNVNANYHPMVINSIGISIGGYGILAHTVMNSHGYSATGSAAINGLVVNNCTAERTSAASRAIEATIANGCHAIMGTNLITHKYNMP